jgi:sugar phosphate isomerase/epimerase
VVSPDKLTPDALILASSSLPALPFEQRVSAAARAGFDAIGLSIWEWDRLRAAGTSVAAMRDSLRAHNMVLAEIEVHIGFSATPHERRRDPLPGVPYTDPDTEARMFEMARAFGARHLQAVGTFNTDIVEDDAAEAFARLCDRAAEHDLLVALEFVPCTNIGDAETANTIVATAGRDNGGLCVDSWHHFRGAKDMQLLKAIDPQHIVMIQLSDGPTEPDDADFLTDTMTNRRPPGEGDFDLVSFLRALWVRGNDAPISVEVLSPTLGSKLSPSDLAARLATTSRSVVRAARAADATTPADGRSSTEA